MTSLTAKCRGCGATLRVPAVELFRVFTRTCRKCGGISRVAVRSDRIEGRVVHFVTFAGPLRNIPVVS